MIVQCFKDYVYAYSLNVIDIHYHVVIYNRVILLSLNNTVEFF